VAINRRRAASSEISSSKKLDGHRNEVLFAGLIDGKVIQGTQKGDVLDRDGQLYSVKGGTKWQIFLYGYERIKDSSYLNILLPCLEAFPDDAKKYFQDRVEVIEFKEAYVKKHGRVKAKSLTNEEIQNNFRQNEYVKSKFRLAKANEAVYHKLLDKTFLRSFLEEAIFNSAEVSYLVVKDSTFQKDEKFKIFSKEDVLKTFAKTMNPATSKAGNVPEDFNVAGQKTTLWYENKPNSQKNIVEIEIRNDSDIHYRQVRFNMYSRDALNILLSNLKQSTQGKNDAKVVYFGNT
jgi:hypothetical protein